MQKLSSAILVLTLAGCASVNESSRHNTSDLIKAELDKSIQGKAQSDAVAAALLPPLTIEMPTVRPPLEERFSIALNNVPASQFFMSIVSGTRYNMLVHPDVTGTISANLKNVTVFEALDAIHELYGYDYKVEGTRIYIKPIGLQTQVFQVNYLTGNRSGNSNIRVTSGSFNDNVGSGQSGSSSGNSNAPTTATQGTNNLHSVDMSQISTTSNSDFWNELKASLEAIVGNKDGRSIVISPQSGVVVIRAMSNEMRNVTTYLKAMQLSVNRQVILETKILEVQLNNGFQSGINWAAFRNGDDSRYSLGSVLPNTTLQSGYVSPLLSSTALTSTTGQNLAAGGAALGSLFGLAFQTRNFAALLSFLETQGTVHMLSSPRIATLNNQKAVLKVGKDDLFVTNVSTTTTSTAAGNVTTPNVTLQPFFSGIALDVTPQIDDNGNIILHIHPSVSNVTTVEKFIDIGSSSITLPLASRTVSETDSVVRGQDGQVVVIGGLMRQSTVNDRSQVPVAGDIPVVGNLFRNNSQITEKRELVILIKPTVVESSNSWTQNLLESQRRIQALDPDKVSEQR